MVNVILDLIFKYKSEIISALIVLLLTTIYNKFSSILKNFPKVLLYLGELKFKQIVKALIFYILPLIFIIGFIFVLRDRVVTFGIIGLFIIVCSMYLIVIFLTIIGNILKINSEKIKIEKDLLTTIEKGFKDVYIELESQAKITLENKKE